MRCWRAAVASASSESIPISSYSFRARLGPRPGKRVISTRPAGNFSRSAAACGMSPCSSSATSLVSSVAPIPGSSVTRPARTSAAIEVEASRTAFAALR